MFGILLLFAAPVISPTQDACPSLSVGSGSATKGQASYYAELSGGDPKVRPTFNWTISAGSIAGGQGTPSITVDADPGAIVTATLEVGGYARTCSVMNSSTEQVSDAAPAAEAKCPQFDVKGGKGEKGETLFTATATGPVNTDNLSVNWTVSAGTISAGQGTGQITVEGPKGTDVTATMDISGLPAKCLGVVSATVAF